MVSTRLPISSAHVILTEDLSASTVAGSHDAEIEQLFSADGLLGQAVAGYRPRQSQTEMAKAIVEALVKKKKFALISQQNADEITAYFLTPILEYMGSVGVSTDIFQDLFFLKPAATAFISMILRSASLCV